MSRFAHKPTQDAYTIVDTKSGKPFQWQGNYSEALLHERRLNQAQNEEYCPHCFTRYWASDVQCSSCRNVRG
jgi:hypothetical protein